jgi:GntR family transcriptional regulator/MocR family aminotransferase
VTGIAAGLPATIGLPEAGPREPAVLAAAASHGLALGELGSHWHAPGNHPQGIIVGHGTPAAGSYPAAIDVLVRVLRALA